MDTKKNVAKEFYERIIKGGEITKEEAGLLVNEDLGELTKYANKIREELCGSTFDMCSIINAKSGKCSEDCKFCAQSGHYNTHVCEYPLLDKESIVKEALYNASKGVLRFSIVVSGKRLSDKEVDDLCDTIKEIKSKCNISICASLGLLSSENFMKLKKAGLERVHNNLETSPLYFKNICSTHSFSDKVQALKKAMDDGLEVCSGGIIGMGESFFDRIDMAYALKDLGIKSVPINVLNPIPGTPFEHLPPLSKDEIVRTCSIFRFILPNIFIRLAGGRKLIGDGGRKAFLSGVNAVITGDMLTTAGLSIDSDMKLIKELGYTVRL